MLWLFLDIGKKKLVKILTMDEKDVELEEKGVKMRIKQEKRKATPSMYAYSDELTQSSIIFHEYKSF